MSRQIHIILLVAVMLVTLASSVRDYCTANGRRYPIRGKWRQRNDLCECVYPESFVYNWDHIARFDAKPFCQLNGCPLSPNSRIVVGEGRRFIYGRNLDLCLCTAGNSPNPIADKVAPLFHGNCTDGHRFYYVTFPPSSSSTSAQVQQLE